MATYKNIRIKMKGGKSRLQRVKVLASGKYKFVKNLTQKVTRRTKRKTNPGRKRGVRRMGKKKRRGSGKSLVKTAFKFIRLGALIAPGIHTATSIGGMRGVEVALGNYGGINSSTGKFDWGVLADAWMPYLGACAVTYGIPKIVSIIRRL